MNSEYRWLTELSQLFLDRDYLTPGQTVDQRVDMICGAAERILRKPGFAAAFKANVKKGFYSLSTPIWTNFGNDRGMPISCVVGETSIDTKAGAKPARDVRVGDEVLTHKCEYKAVTDVIVTENRSDIFRLKVAGHPDLYLTGDHLVLTNRGWTRSDGLDPRNHLVATIRIEVLGSLEFLAIEAIERTNRVDTVYDFTVTGDHSFSAAGVVLHNCFGSSIDDSMQSILYTQAEVGMMTKGGGGTSAYFGNLRGRGSSITGNGQSSGSVHFMSLFNNLINVVSQGNCYVEGTEVLTDSGFKDFRRVEGGDKLAQLDEFNNVSFTAEYESVVEDFDGDLVCLGGKKSVSIKVTPNHRMVVSRRKTEVGNWYWPDHTEIVPAKDFRPHRDNSIPLAGWAGEGAGLTTLDRLRVAFQAHGLKDGPDRKIRFRFRKQTTGTVAERTHIPPQEDDYWVPVKTGSVTETLPGASNLSEVNDALFFRRKLLDGWKAQLWMSEGGQTATGLSPQDTIDRLVGLLETAGIEYKTYLSPSGTLSITIGYDAEIKRDTLDWVHLDAINGRWAEEFLDELTRWDGAVAHGGALIYRSIVKENIDKVQAIAALADKKTRLRSRKAKDNRKTLYSIRVSENAYRGGESIKVSRERYKGKVYCAVVPLGRLIVRHEGRVMVCGNTRRGNFAAYLPIDHADIHEFLAIKSDGHPIQDLSTGVCVPDYWMEEMIAGDAAKRKVWARVLECRSHSGFPYIFFSDTANRETVDVYRDKGMRITHSNLCSEIFLPDSADESFVCDLSSMNILHYDEWKDTDAVSLLSYFLDAVMTEFVAKAREVPFLERCARFGERHRALGIGWIGWHSYLQSRMIPFESMEAKLLNVEIAKRIKEQAYAASARLAEEYGEPEVLRGYGRRNTTLLAIAPTKSSAFILGQVSEAVEPHRSNFFIKDLQKGKFTIKNPRLLELLEAKGANTDATWEAILRHGGSVQRLDCLTPEEKDVFKTFAEISPREIVVQAAQRQRYIDQSQSLNLMIHPSVPIRDVNALIIDAWRLGVKSLYYQLGVNAAQQFSRSIMDCASCSS